MIGKIMKKDYIAPENDHWRHANSNYEDESEHLSGMVEKCNTTYKRVQLCKDTCPKL
ncbi:hypothetical protein Hanom_Chr16g01429231 [Helianthus anomalus]